MLKQICHHTYKLPGTAIDISRYENNGQVAALAQEPNGATPKSGAVLFTSDQSYVRIPTGASFRKIKALRVDMLAQLPTAQSGKRLNLIEGHLAFAFYVNPDGTLVGTFFCSPSPGAPPAWIGVSSKPPHSPDGAVHTVPRGQWLQLSYLHDGVRTLEIALNGTVVGRRTDLVAGIGDVGAFGVAIGTWPDAQRYTLTGGRIDDLQIWRYDPDALVNEFFSRPMTEDEWKCWAKVFRAIAIGLDNGDKRLIAALQSIDQAVAEIVRDAAADAQFVRNNRTYARTLQSLWSTDQLDGPAMQKLQTDWFADLNRATGQTGKIDPRLRRIAETFVDSGLAAAFGRFDCDPDFAKLIGMIAKIVN
jgi:hypothetical protein